MLSLHNIIERWLNR